MYSISQFPTRLCEDDVTAVTTNSSKSTTSCEDDFPAGTTNFPARPMEQYNSTTVTLQWLLHYQTLTTSKLPNQLVPKTTGEQ